MKTITIGFSKPKNRLLPIGSWLIRLYQKTEYSHVYLEFYSESTNRGLIYEAVGSGIRFIGTKQWELHAQEVKSFTISITNCNYVELMQFCIDNSGNEYGFLQNIGIFIADLFNLSKNPVSKGMNCSEVLGKILKLEGYLFDKEDNLLTPKDIELALVNKQP
jgi:hypothetical protein